MIDGKPMIQHVHARAAAASRVDVVLVATDDQRIADVVDGFGGVAVMTGAHHPTGTDRLAEVAASLSGDIIVNVQGDEPMIDASAIDACVDALTTHPDDVMSTVRRPLGDDEAENPAVVKVVVDHADVALYFSRASLPHVRGATPPRWAHLGLYGYRRTFQRSWSLPRRRSNSRKSGTIARLEHGYRIRCVKAHSVSVGVDTAEDLNACVTCSHVEA
jgi:3-deoxy-manno-octulosonate cytidylyltransferase (CMP-KDO synthetase)